ncbi:MAG: efflux RND transporter periplasmic adaptor subunit [Desulfovermiculus sp.]
MIGIIKFLSRFILMLAVFIFPGCNGQPEVDSDSSAPSRPRPVVTMTVPEPDGPSRVYYPGQVQAAVQTRLSFEQNGRIQEVFVKEGSRVQRGQLLARLDPGDYQLAVEERRARLREVQARLQEARSSYRRVKALYETQNISRKELDETRGSLQALEARQEAARNALSLAEQDLKDCMLRAPLAGHVADVPVEVHQTVQAGQPVVVLNSDQDMHVRIQVPESIIARIEIGTRARVRIDALSGKKFAARVSEAGVQAGPLSTYPLELTLQEQEEDIRAGMAAQASLNLDAVKQSVHVPAQAVFGQAGQKRYVWVVNRQSSRVGKREVQVGTFAEQGVQILSGLDQGETIVLRGVHRLQEDMEVHILDESGRPVPEE